MSLLGNIIWFVFGGLLLGLAYIFFGLLYCITIVGIPFGYQLMKIGFYAMHPFGKSPTFDPVPMGCLSLVFNILWIIFGGIELAIAHLIVGTVFCVTIIGIPFGMQHFKLAKLAILPFGQTLKSKE